MVWRSVMISRPAKLRRELYSLAIEQEETAFVPFEDIAVIVLNHREITSRIRSYPRARNMALVYTPPATTTSRPVYSCPFCPIRARRA